MASKIRREPSPTELTQERVEEIARCYDDYVYFVDRYCKIYDSVEKGWIDFTLWESQKTVLRTIDNNQLTVILKARQLGITWIALSYALWSMLFRSIASISVFSRRETEAIYLVGVERLRGMHAHLPPWMITGNHTVTNAEKLWSLQSGSTLRAFPTSAGDGYVSTLAIVDEADLSPDLNSLLRSVKPTIDNGGKMILLSRSNKEEPESEFKQIYRQAKAKQNPWFPVFLPWTSHPGRTEEWYARQKQDILSRTGSLDDLYEQYPATDAQALASKTLDKRIPILWLEPCYAELRPLRARNAPAIGDLDIYREPVLGSRYVIGADPAEGNPNSDDSAITVLDAGTGEEVATFAGKIEPAVFGYYISLISNYYNYAAVMVERNNHGHSVIQWLEEHAKRTRLLLGHDAEMHKQDRKARKRRKTLKYGWLSSTLGKTILYTTCTEYFRANSGLADSEAVQPPTIVIHTLQTFTQLSEIEAGSLRAPEGMMDDRADSFALAVAGRVQLSGIAHSAVLLLEKAKGW